LKMLGQQASNTPLEPVSSVPPQQDGINASEAVACRDESHVEQGPVHMQVPAAGQAAGSEGRGIDPSKTAAPSAAAPTAFSVPESQPAGRAGASGSSCRAGTQVVPATPASAGAPPQSGSQQGPSPSRVVRAVEPRLESVAEGCESQPTALTGGNVPAPVKQCAEARCVPPVPPGPVQSQGTELNVADQDTLACPRGAKPVLDGSDTHSKEQVAPQLPSQSPLPLAQPPPGSSGAAVDSNPFVIQQASEHDEPESEGPAHMHEVQLPGSVVAMCCSPCGSLLATLMVEETCTGTAPSDGAAGSSTGSDTSKSRAQRSHASAGPARGQGGSSSQQHTALVWFIHPTSKQLKLKGALPVRGLPVNQQASQQVLAVMQPYRCGPCTPATGARGSGPSWGQGLVHGGCSTAAKAGPREPHGCAETPYTGAPPSGLPRHHTPLQPLLAVAGSLTTVHEQRCVSITCLLQDGTWTEPEVLCTQMVSSYSCMALTWSTEFFICSKLHVLVSVLCQALPLTIPVKPHTACRR
jgi:hypothetical protein